MTAFQEILINWYGKNKRSLPWRDSPSPYHVWLSEVILQQTRVNQGMQYYLNFIEKWPKVEDLAKASEQEILKMWQGLGYYSRARNLSECAQQVDKIYGGIFPKNITELKKLKGIGDYTAAAIASIAYQLPYAVVDGNVYRVLSRVFNIETAIDSTEGKKQFSDLAQSLLPEKRPGEYNQAIMEFGALFCTPKNPTCISCPLKDLCFAYAHNTVANRPVKAKMIFPQVRYLNYLVIRLRKENEDYIYLHQRKGQDIWKNLYDFPLIESEEPLSTEDLISHKTFKELFGKHEFLIQRVSPVYTHKLTHRTLLANFTEIKIKNLLSPKDAKDLSLTNEKNISEYPIPRLIEKYLHQ